MISYLNSFLFAKLAELNFSFVDVEWCRRASLNVILFYIVIVSFRDECVLLNDCLHVVTVVLSLGSRVFWFDVMLDSDYLRRKQSGKVNHHIRFCCPVGLYEKKRNFIVDSYSYRMIKVLRSICYWCSEKVLNRRVWR
jgi:hypothetical protein